MPFNTGDVFGKGDSVVCLYEYLGKKQPGYSIFITHYLVFFFFIFVDIFIYSLSIYSVFGGIIVNRKAIRQLDAVVLIFG